MKFLSKLFLLVVVFSTMTFAQLSTVYVDVTNGSDAYTGANATNNPAGSGPKATIAGGLAVLADEGNLIIRAGDYNGIDNAGAAFVIDAASAPNITDGFTITLMELNTNTAVNLTAGNFEMDIADAVVTITNAGNGEVLVQTGTTVTLTNGDVNLVDAAYWTIPTNTEFVMWDDNAFTNAAPAKSAAANNVFLTYRGAGNVAAGPEANYGTYNGGDIEVNKTSGTATFPYDITFGAANTSDVILLTAGNATFSGNVVFGLGDVVNNSAGTLTLNGDATFGVTESTVPLATEISSAVNTAGGKLYLNGNNSWVADDNVTGGDDDFTTIPIIDNQNGTMVVGPVDIIADNTNALGNFEVMADNQGTLTLGVVDSPDSGTKDNFGIFHYNNDGIASVAGGTYLGTFTNSATNRTTLTGALIVSDVVTNAGTVVLGDYRLTIDAATVNLTNGGTFTAVTGALVVDAAAGAVSFNGGTLSNVIVETGAVTFITNQVNISDLTVNGGTLGVNIATLVGGTTNIAGGVTTVAVDIQLKTLNFEQATGGTFVLSIDGADADAIGSILQVAGNFNRTGGTFTANANSLLWINGTIAQTVDGGPLFQVSDITFTNSVSGILVRNTIRVSSDAVISTATNVDFGTVNLVLNADNATIINNGYYTTEEGSGGGLIVGGANLVVGGTNADQCSLEGTGIYSYITIDVVDGQEARVINTTTGVKFDGVLRLYTGDLVCEDVGVDFSPYGTSAKIIRHLWDVADVNQPALIDASTGGADVGTFNAAGVPFDLEYTSSNVTPGAPPRVVNVDLANTSVEFPVDPTVLVRNLSFTQEAGIVAHLTSSHTFTADLLVGATATVRIDEDGAAEGVLTSTGTDASHTVAGLIEQAGTDNTVEELLLSGTGVLEGSGTGVIERLEINTTGEYAINNLAALGAAVVGAELEVNNGTVTLAMAELPPATTFNPGDVFNFDLNAGQVTLGYHMDVPYADVTSFNADAGTIFDFADYNVNWYGAKVIGVTNVTDAIAGRVITVAAGHGLAVGDLISSDGTNPHIPAGSYTVATVAVNDITLTGLVGLGGAADATAANIHAASLFASDATTDFLATGATTNGFLLIDDVANINTNGAIVPRIGMDPEEDGIYELRLTGDLGVSEYLNNEGNDIIELDGNVFELAGTTIWNHGGTATYPSTAGNGLFYVTGAVTANLASNVVVPNLQLDNGTDTFTLVDNDAVPATVPSVTVTDPTGLPGVFTMTDGTIDQALIDVILVDAGAVFNYVAGTIIATTNTGLTADDDDNGELVFNHPANADQTFTGAIDFTIPALRIEGNSNVAAANSNNDVNYGSTTNVMVSDRLVFGVGHDLDFSGANIGLLKLDDECWVERRGVANVQLVALGPWVEVSGRLIEATDNVGVIDLYYNYNTTTAVAAHANARGHQLTVGNEAPDADNGTRNLYVSAMNVNTDAVPSTQDFENSVLATQDFVGVAELHLIDGMYDPMPGTTMYAMTMAENSLVVRYDGRFTATTNFAIDGGPIDLTYANLLPLTTQSYEYPTTIEVKTLTAQGRATAVLHADRSCLDFVLNTGATTVTNVKFDLDGNTLSVTAPSTATLTKGILTSEEVVAGEYVFGTLNVTGPTTSTANATITNVNVNASTMTLAGVFTTDDVDGPGANNVVVGLPTATVLGDFTTSALFNGNLVVDGNVTVTAPGTFSAASNIEFTGTEDVNLTVPTAGVNVGGITLNKDAGYRYVTLVNGTDAATRTLITCLGTVDFINGIFRTGIHTIRLSNPNTTMLQGFTRANLTGLSHIIGNVAKQPKVGTIKPWSRSEFPVGDEKYYRPATISVTDVVNTNLAAWVTVSETSTEPTGTLGLPVEHNEKQYSRFPDFHWYIRSTQSLGQIIFDLELTAGGYKIFDEVSNVVLLRRQGTIADQNNPWILQGTEYDNNVVEEDSIVTVININSVGGIRPEGGIFTFGIPTQLWTLDPATYLPDRTIGIGESNQEEVTFDGFFQGASGDLVYTVQAANPQVVEVTDQEFTDPKFTITGIQNGSSVISIKAKDNLNNDFITATFVVTVDGTVDIEVVEEIPTEYQIAQNFPNPFNPTTKIKFGLPEQSNVVLKVYNILGEEVAQLVSEILPAGFHTINFDASRLTSGLYIYRIEAGNFVEVKKMMLMK